MLKILIVGFGSIGDRHLRNILTKKGIQLIVCSKRNDMVYSTGGGIILNTINQNILQTRGISFFLDCTTDTTINRLKNKNKNRPLFKIDNDIISLYNNRINLYKKCAHYIIDTNQLTQKQITTQIVTLYNENN